MSTNTEYALMLALILLVVVAAIGKVSSTTNASLMSTVHAIERYTYSEPGHGEIGGDK